MSEVKDSLGDFLIKSLVQHLRDYAYEVRQIPDANQVFFIDLNTGEIVEVVLVPIKLTVNGAR